MKSPGPPPALPLGQVTPDAIFGREMLRAIHEADAGTADCWREFFLRRGSPGAEPSPQTILTNAMDVHQRRGAAINDEVA